MTGSWRCRTLKLGGNLPLTVYPWFACRVSDDSTGRRLEKLTGSQRSSGAFTDDRLKRLVYLGALHYADEPPFADGQNLERDQAAYAIRPAEDADPPLFSPLPLWERTTAARRSGEGPVTLKGAPGESDAPHLARSAPSSPETGEEKKRPEL